MKITIKIPNLSKSWNYEEKTHRHPPKLSGTFLSNYTIGKWFFLRLNLRRLIFMCHEDSMHSCQNCNTSNVINFIHLNPCVYFTFITQLLVCVYAHILSLHAPLIFSGMCKYLSGDKQSYSSFAVRLYLFLGVCILSKSQCPRNKQSYSTFAILLYLFSGICISSKSLCWCREMT